MPRTKRVAVAELNVFCDYPGYPDESSGASCQRAATTVVIDVDDNQFYRCLAHQGAVSPGVLGSTRYMVKVSVGTEVGES